MKYFAMIGAGGDIAPRHMRAVRESGNRLCAALDPHDSVGALDQWFPGADFFTEFERFDRHIDKLKRTSQRIDAISICSPNYLHDAHIRFTLKNGADAVCEMPLVLNPWNAEALAEMEIETGRVIHPMLPFRLHPSMVKLKRRIDHQPNKVYDVALTCIQPRGKWYFISWRGREEKSGGIATHMGIHYLDLLIWLFGDVRASEVHINGNRRSSGLLELEKARVRWFFSLSSGDLPVSDHSAHHRSIQSITVNRQEIDLAGDFDDLYARCYRNITKNNGFKLEDVRSTIVAAYDIRNARPAGSSRDHNEKVHPDRDAVSDEDLSRTRDR